MGTENSPKIPDYYNDLLLTPHKYNLFSTVNAAEKLDAYIFDTFFIAKGFI